MARLDAGSGIQLSQKRSSPHILMLKIDKISQIDVRDEIKRVLNGLGRDNGRHPDLRYSSFDYCYNYFYSFKNNPSKLATQINIQTSCLQLGFYLASWGMLRGSSFLLTKSVRSYATLIKEISKMDPEIWKIDVPNYSDKNIKILLETKRKIVIALGKENKPSDTLVTKIMLGVFANVPAYDNYFKKFLSGIGASQTFNKTSLNQIREFYEIRKKDFEFKIQTHDFLSGSETKLLYTKAKLVDMCGFANGQH